MVIESSGDPATPNQGLDMLRRGGKLLILAFYKDPVSFNLGFANREEISLVTSRGEGRQAVGRALAPRRRRTDQRRTPRHPPVSAGGDPGRVRDAAESAGQTDEGGVRPVIDHVIAFKAPDLDTEAEKALFAKLSELQHVPGVREFALGKNFGARSRGFDVCMRITFDSGRTSTPTRSTRSTRKSSRTTARSRRSTSASTSSRCNALVRERKAAERDDPAREAADEKVLGDGVDADVPVLARLRGVDLREPDHALGGDDSGCRGELTG